MIDYKTEVLRLLSIDTMLRGFGFTPKRGFIHCPFHTEDTASCRIYLDTDTFYCFGCGKGGNVIDFAMAWYDLNFWQTIEQLNEEFSLNLPIGRKMTLREKYEITLRTRQAAEQRAKKQEEHDQLFATYWTALDKLRTLEKAAKKFAPKTPDDDPNPFYGAVLSLIPAAEYEFEEAESKVILYAGG